MVNIKRMFAQYVLQVRGLDSNKTRFNLSFSTSKKNYQYQVRNVTVVIHSYDSFDMLAFALLYYFRDFRFWIGVQYFFCFTFCRGLISVINRSKHLLVLDLVQVFSEEEIWGSKLVYSFFNPPCMTVVYSSIILTKMSEQSKQT